MDNVLANQIQGFEDRFQQYLANGDILEASYWLNRIRPYTTLVKKPLDKATVRSLMANLELELEKATTSMSLRQGFKGIKNARQSYG